MKNSNKKEIEQNLLPRLKWMSFILFALALGSLLIAFIGPKELSDEVQALIRLQERLFGEIGKLEPRAHEVLNFYVVSAIFAIIGLSLFLIFWKKSKSLLKTNGEEQ